MRNQSKQYFGNRKPITPWGRADTVTIFENGIKFYSTPSHGGYFVPKHLRQAILPFCLNAMTTQWYEEDCEALKVFLAFPELLRDPATLDEIKKSYNYWFNPDGSCKQ